MNNEKHTNALIDETSPYLLQHAHNPVDWMPWGDEALEKAKKEDKPIIISIGYSSCHWCHVMEHESFEDTAVARVMNENFICIKVDREERPDVDQHYMEAVQLISGRGGWPLNCFALPDGRAFYGGTYFNKKQWLEVLDKVQEQYHQNREDLYELAARITNGIKGQNMITLNTLDAKPDEAILNETVKQWKSALDYEEGGRNSAPKFPMPNNYRFLLNYSLLNEDEDLKKQVKTTLDKMAAGGIYDHAGGGFARYSTDPIWKVPHFEKMLYDNGQLLSLYSKGYQVFKSSIYKRVVDETVTWLEREMLDKKSGAFYSALDADSEGEEGKYYVWTKEELKELLGEDFDWVSDYYNVNKKGLWEHNKNILLTNLDDEGFAKQKGWTLDELYTKLDEVKSKLYKKREERVRPGLDDKSLTSWNALVISGLCDAYLAFGDNRYKELALNNAKWIVEKQWQKNGSLFHSFKEGKSSIQGFLEDYAFTIEAFQKLYEITGDEDWIHQSEKLMSYVMEHFQDADSRMFYFTENEPKSVLHRKIEVLDNVIPATNSTMANALLKQGTLMDKEEYRLLSDTLLKNVYEKMPKYGAGYSNWGLLYLKKLFPYYEIAIVGANAEARLLELNNTTFIPQKVFLTSQQESDLPLLEGKYVEGETIIYVCVNKACKLPVTSVNEAIEQLK